MQINIVTQQTRVVSDNSTLENMLDTQYMNNASLPFWYERQVETENSKLLINEQQKE